MTDTPDVDMLKKALPNFEVMWNQNVLNHSQRILSICDTDDKVEQFLRECQGSITDIDKCNIKWNLEVQQFGGDEYGYVATFFSDILQVPVKVAIKIQLLEQVIMIGRMDIAPQRDGGSQKSIRTGDDIN